MILILFRHGHKGQTPFQDPDLTPKGFDQALDLVTKIEQGILPQPTHCWFSEMIRTKQTLQKVIEKYQPKNFQKSELNIRNHIGAKSETTQDFRTRIQKFCNDLVSKQKPSEVHFICTHYDWIEEVLTLINSDKDLNSFEFSNWAPGQYLVFEIESSDKYQPWKVLKKGILS
jgi:broad specificity phosphatase PhoE